MCGNTTSLSCHKQQRVLQTKQLQISRLFKAIMLFYNISTHMKYCVSQMIEFRIASTYCVLQISYVVV